MLSENEIAANIGTETVGPGYEPFFLVKIRAFHPAGEFKRKYDKTDENKQQFEGKFKLPEGLRKTCKSLIQACKDRCQNGSLQYKHKPLAKAFDLFLAVPSQMGFLQADTQRTHDKLKEVVGEAIQEYGHELIGMTLEQIYCRLESLPLPKPRPEEKAYQALISSIRA